MNLTDAIAPSFYEVHKDIKENKHTHYWFKGGRGSTKSSFISLEIILGMMKDKDANALVLRKVSDKLEDSVYSQLIWAIDKLGVSDYWAEKQQPLKLIYKPTKQVILFRGSNNKEDYKKIKSIKIKKGFIKYGWYEEVDEFNGAEEIRSINQSILRGGSGFKIFYSYNPPKSSNNWVNTEILNTENKYIHTSCYLDVPKEWLGEEFFIEAEYLKKSNELAYKNEYLGEVTGTGGAVFTNLEIREITDEEIKTFDNIKAGIDWGFAVDPAVYTENYYNKTRNCLVIFKEIYKVGLKNRIFAEEIKKIRTSERTIITCDSAEPKSIDEMEDYNLRVEGAKKGPDSIEYGIKWLQDLDKIIIDPKRCPNTAKEFSKYELERTKDGSFKSSYPDKDNHAIDATRYSREADINHRKEAKVFNKNLILGR